MSVFVAISEFILRGWHEATVPQTNASANIVELISIRRRVFPNETVDQVVVGAHPQEVQTREWCYDAVAHVARQKAAFGPLAIAA